MRPSAVAVLLAALACARPGTPRPSALPAPPPWEAENPVRPLPAAPLGSGADLARLPWVTPEKVRLGRWLFYDPRLSADGTISCATCHDPARGFSENAPVSTGIGGLTGRRKAQPILNAAFPVAPRWFWDGRAASLAEQAKGPIENPVEMGNTLEGAVRAVAAGGYRPYFREAFGDDRVDADRLAEAIAAYEATRLSGNSRYDRHDAGDPAALDAEERWGKELFFGRADCKQCHLGPGLTDGAFHNLGVGWREPPPGADLAEGFEDKGRFEVTGDPADMGAFKTPTLREVSRRAPYMHDGSVPDLWDAVLHYWRGGIPNPWLSERIVPIPLSRADVAALVAFMEALDGEGWADEPPRSFPR
jgi:cytochrome c peroxidase